MEIILWLLCGAICYYIAERKNRNPWWGAGMGMIFGILAVIVYCFLGTKPKVISSSTTTTTTTQSN